MKTLQKAKKMLKNIVTNMKIRYELSKDYIPRISPKNTVRLGLAAGILAPGIAYTQNPTGNIEIVQPQGQKSFLEMNLNYNLGDLKGYTFLDINQNNDGYFGKTKLSKSGLEMEIVHGTGFKDQYGWGVKLPIPQNKYVFGNIYNKPIWIDSQGKSLDKKTIGGFLGANLGKGIETCLFGEWNYENKTWGYGEASIGIKIGDQWFVKYNPALISDGDATPKVQHRVGIESRF